MVTSRFRRHSCDVKRPKEERTFVTVVPEESRLAVTQVEVGAGRYASSLAGAGVLLRATGLLRWRSMTCDSNVEYAPNQLHNLLVQLETISVSAAESLTVNTLM